MSNEHTILTQQTTLRKSVNYHFECDIAKKCKETRFVNARMTFSYIMRERGYTLQSIGRLLNKNHATIINYLKNIEWYLKTDTEFRGKFNNVYEECYLDEESVYLLDKDKLIKEVFSLKEKNKILSSQVESLKKEKEIYKRDEIRFETIFETIKKRTHSGSEDEVLSKLNQMYNGLYN